MILFLNIKRSIHSDGRQYNKPRNSQSLAYHSQIWPDKKTDNKDITIYKRRND